MESTVVIVLLFVFTIFSSFSDNKGYTPPTVTVKPAKEVSQPSGPVNPGLKSNIKVSYNDSVEPTTKSTIATFICGFRKPEQAAQITDSIMKHCKTYDVNPKLVTALIRRESGFNPRAISKSGAGGLGQLLPSTAQGLGVSNVFDIDQNAKATIRYVKYLLTRFKGYSDQVSFALAGYLEGPNAVARNKGYTSTTGKYVKDILGIYHKL